MSEATQCHWVASEALGPESTQPDRPCSAPKTQAFSRCPDKVTIPEWISWSWFLASFKTIISILNVTDNNCFVEHKKCIEIE